MLSLLRQRNFALLWIGGLISFTGDWVMLVALPVHIYNLTGSVLATGAMFIAASLPSILLGPVAGVYVDRWDRKLTMVVANLLAVPLILSLLLVQSAQWVWITYLVTFGMSVVRQFMGPAENALLPKLVPESDLPTANALNTLNNNLARLAGPAIGGVIFAYLGFTAAALLDAASFMVAALLITLIAAPPGVTRAEPDEHEAAGGLAQKGVWLELVAGLQVVRRNRIVAALFTFVGIGTLAEGFFGVLIVVYAREVLRGGAQELGWLLTAQAVGGILGSLFIGYISKVVKPSTLVALGMLLLGAIDIVIFNVPILALNLVLMALVGIPVVGFQTGLQTLMQTNVADRYRGRVFAAFGTIISLAILVGMSFASLLGNPSNAVLLLTIGSSFYLTMGIVALVFFARERAGAPATAPVRGGEIESFGE